MALSIAVVVVALAVAAFLSLSPRLRASASWNATATPLASIMGSGFLISAPLLARHVGNFALLSMAALLLLAYLVGYALRFNIRHFEPVERAHGWIQEVGFAARLVLAGAYFISVSYYLQLLAAFVLRAAGSPDPTVAHLIASAFLVAIGGVGTWRGLDGLERFTRVAEGLNLGMIAALLMGLAVYNGELVAQGAWHMPELGVTPDLSDLRVVLGLLVVVQGFETSRYLGDEHPAELRIRTMRRAQLVSGVIYLAFIGLATVLFRKGLQGDVTAIIEMTRPVAGALPLLLAFAAVGSQFSAAIADESGAGGLIEDITQRRVSVRSAYALILLVTLTLTWGTDIYGIIAYASRAFALFYALQGAVALMLAWQRRDLPWRGPRLAAFALATAACLAVFWLGLPSE